MTIATKLNAWLTPARRQALYVVITVLGTLVLATSPIQSEQVAIWMQLAFAVGVVGSQILGSIVTKSVPWRAVYRVLGILVAAITAAGWLSGAHADLVMRILEQFGAIVPMIAILLRTDTSTATGSPSAEVAPVTPVVAYTVNVSNLEAAAPVPGVPMPSDMAIADPVTSVPADGTPPTVLSN